ncbi:imelysin family protein [Persicitalea jodogahamensis]|uniref:Imelysin-like domain-containing protein n=1 Tax=Persicitalea jodogahamensis TaxID=402147 RepID=A0A8J3GAH9_9BACT|nr:imelysin family protein [Persicitalea jodogahamensis]GHB73293.1 hypothetical protein GCM10007390_29280 [Persicitalea jodogahamensis]
MQRLRFTFLLSLAAAMLSLIPACTSSNLEVEKPEQFALKDMLRHYADDLIIPSFKELQTNVNTLQQAAETLAAQPTLANLSALQTTWTKTHLAFQSVNAYNFGPAGKSGSRKNLVQEIGTFPTDIREMEITIAKGLPVPNDENYGARGMLAIEYLIFDVNGDNQRILDGLITASREVYLRKQIANVKTQVDSVVTGWATYRDTFINSDGTAVGSSISELYNGLVQSFEDLKNRKVDLPLDGSAGQQGPQPTLVEAYYSGKSLEFIRAHFTALEDIWRGRVGQQDGLGFDNYLQTVRGGPALVSSTDTQFAAIRQALAGLGETSSLTKEIQNNRPKVEKLQTELQNNTRYLKSDMSSVLGLTLTVQ